MKRMGVDSTCLVAKANFFDFGGDEVLSRPGDSRVIYEVRRLRALSYIFRYNVIFFNFGKSLYAPITPMPHGWQRIMTLSYNIVMRAIQQVELAVLKFRKCTLLVQYQGDDARQGDTLERLYSYSHLTEVEPDYYTRESDRLKRTQISLFSKYCQVIYALNPDLLQVLPKSSKFLPYAAIDIADWPATFRPRTRQSIRIGHAPTNRSVKGTQYVLETVADLRDEGYPVELVLIEGLSNSEARAKYQSIDLMIDQLFVGWYGGLAVEAMALGKPVIAYIREEDLHAIPSDMRRDVPIITATRKTLKAALKQVVELSDAEWLALQHRSREYVGKWHNPKTICERILEDISRMQDPKPSSKKPVRRAPSG